MLARFRGLVRPVAPPTASDHFDVCRLTGSFVLVDRAPLRAKLKGLNTAAGRRILKVNGARGSGKSHTVRFITYLADMLGFSAIVVDLEDYRDDDPPTAEVLSQHLVSLLGYGLLVAEPTDTQWSRWIISFCNDFEAAAQRDPHDRWIVIDAFNSVVVEQNALDLVGALAKRVSLRLPHFRLVLVGFEGELPDKVSGHLDEERVSHLRDRDLVEFFVKAFAQHGIVSDVEGVAATVERVLDGLDPDDHGYVAAIAGPGGCGARSGRAGGGRARLRLPRCLAGGDRRDPAPACTRRHPRAAAPELDALIEAAAVLGWFEAARDPAGGRRRLASRCCSSTPGRASRPAAPRAGRCSRRCGSGRCASCARRGGCRRRWQPTAQRPATRWAPRSLRI